MTAVTARIILGMMKATGFPSMWISGAATTAMMHAVGVSVSERTNDGRAFRDFRPGGHYRRRRLSNALRASCRKKPRHGNRLFRGMLLRGPIVAVMLPLNGPLGAGDPSRRQNRRGRTGRSAMQQTSNLGAMDRAGKRVGRIISVTAFPWITWSWPTYAMGPDFTDAMIGMAAVPLFAIPRGPRHGDLRRTGGAACGIFWRAQCRTGWAPRASSWCSFSLHR